MKKRKGNNERARVGNHCRDKASKEKERLHKQNLMFSREDEEIVDADILNSSDEEEDEEEDEDTIRKEMSGFVDYSDMNTQMNNSTENQQAQLELQNILFALSNGKKGKLVKKEKR